MKRSKKTLVVIIVLILAILIYGIYWAFYDIQRIDGQKKIAELSSPDHQYTMTAYLNNGGATVDYAVLGCITNNQTGKTKNIYWNDHCTDAEIRWLDENTVEMNGVVLNVLKDTYDYRHD